MKRSKREVGKKILSVVSAAALLMSCGFTGVLTGLDSVGIVAKAESSTNATQLKVYDEDGNDLGDNPVFYVDNSNVNGDNLLSRRFTVVASNDNGTAVEDEIRLFAESNASDYLAVNGDKDCKPLTANEQMNVTVSGGYNDPDKDNNWVAKKSGTTHLYLTTAGGEVYRSVTIVVYQPATDMKISQITPKGKSLFPLNDYNEFNSVMAMSIANHKYEFMAEKDPTNSTDTVEWLVYDGYYDGTTTPQETKKAEITQAGLFTPKTNGEVTIVAKYKATETSKREKSYGKKKLQDKQYDFFENVPKYIHMTIVKENPATSIAIKNAPGAMEVGDTMKLAIESTPTYTGAGYETGATDVFAWRSTNPGVVSVDEEGNITAVGKGDAKIIVYGENENVTAEADIRVLTMAQSISFVERTLSTRVDIETSVTAVMNPTTADEEIEWTSSNPSIATVETASDGVLTNRQSAVVRGVSTGSVIITARAKNSGREANITCNVTKKIEAADINLSTQKGNEVTNIYDNSIVQVYDQNQITISGELVSEDGSLPDDTLEWEVIGNGENNGDYVTIDEVNDKTITLTGFARGTVYIKASSRNNSAISKTFSLEVLKRATKATIVNNSSEDGKFNKNLNVGLMLSLGADLQIDTNRPYDHDDIVESWTSSNTNAVVIDNDGFLRVVGNGTSTITMVTQSGLKATTNITGFTTSSITIRGVTIQSDGSLPITSINLTKLMDGSKQLSATVKNEKDSSVSDAYLEWESSDENVVTVDRTGKLSAHNIGEAVITVRSGNKIDQCIVYVYYLISNTTISYDTTVYYSPMVVEYEPEVRVSYSYTVKDANDEDSVVEVELVKDLDYTVKYANNTTVGKTGTITITGLEYYQSPAVTKNFSIKQRPLTDAEIEVSPLCDQELTAVNKDTGANAPVSMYHSGVALKEGTDFTATYSNNKKPGTATVKIAGIGNYTGTLSGSYDIYCTHSSKTLLKEISKADCQHEGKAQYRCDLCSAVIDDITPTTDHLWEKQYVVQANYEHEGYTLYKCSACGEEEHRDIVPMLTKTKISECTVTIGDKTYSTDDVITTLSGKKITVSAQASGGTEPYGYSFYYKRSTNTKWVKIGTEFGTETSASFTPSVAAEFDFKVVAKDQLENTDEKLLKINVTEGLQNTSYVNSETVQIGDDIRVTGAATGGEGAYRYAFYFKRSTNSKWNKIGTEFGTKLYGVTIPKVACVYDMKVSVMDDAGTVVTKTFKVNVLEKMDLTNISTINGQNIPVGKTVTIAGRAVGGTKPMTYEFYFKRAENTKWNKLSYGSEKMTYAKFTPLKAAEYQVKSVATDAEGTKAEKIYTVIAEEAQ